MKSRFKIAAMVMVLGVLCVGVVALAIDFVWDGGNTTDDGWTRPTNWVQDSGYPDDTGDNATIADVTPHSTCTFDDNTERSINNLEVTGDSPTWMKLHVKNAALNVQDLDLNDYGELDIDQDLTVNDDMFLSGSTKIDVASTKTLNVNELFVDGPNAVLDLTTSGTFVATFLDINADVDNAQRSLKLNGGTLTLGYPTGTLLVAGNSAGYKAKLWVPTGAVVWDSAPVAKSLKLHGGDDFATDRAELDLDQDLTIPTSGGSFDMHGAVKIDIAADKTLRTPSLVIGSSNVASVVKLVAASGAKLDVN